MTRKETIALLNGLRKGRLPISDVYAEWPYKTYFFYPNKPDYYENESVPVSSEEVLTDLRTYPKIRLFPVGIPEAAVNARILKLHEKGIKIFVPLPDPLSESDKQTISATQRAFRKAMQKTTQSFVENELSKNELDPAHKKEYKEMKERIDGIISKSEEEEAYLLDKINRQFKGDDYEEKEKAEAHEAMKEPTKIVKNEIFDKQEIKPQPTQIETVVTPKEILPSEALNIIPEEPPPKKIDYHECGSQRGRSFTTEGLGDMMRRSGVF